MKQGDWCAKNTSYIHALKLNWGANGRRAPRHQTPGEGGATAAGHTKLFIMYAVGPNTLDTRGTGRNEGDQEGHQRGQRTCY
jgi:hypothetical protein